MPAYNQKIIATSDDFAHRLQGRAASARLSRQPQQVVHAVAAHGLDVTRKVGDDRCHQTATDWLELEMDDVFAQVQGAVFTGDTEQTFGRHIDLAHRHGEVILNDGAVERIENLGAGEDAFQIQRRTVLGQGAQDLRRSDDRVRAIGLDLGQDHLKTFIQIEETQFQARGICRRLIERRVERQDESHFRRLKRKAWQGLGQHDAQPFAAFGIGDDIEPAIAARAGAGADRQARYLRRAALENRPTRFGGHAGAVEIKKATHQNGFVDHRQIGQGGALILPVKWK